MNINRRQAIAMGAAGLSGCVAPGDHRPGHIDAHSHIWTSDVKRFPLAPGKTVADLNPRSFTPETLIALGKT